MLPDLVIRDIDVLLTMTGAGLGRLDQAAIAIAGGRVVWTGPTAEAPPSPREISGRGALAMPGLVDCHTHAAFAGSRARDFELRLAGRTYAEILEQGGGIHTTVSATRAASKEDLTAWTARRLADMADRGVTTVEVKSGYGLTPSDERKQLEAALQAGARADVEVVPTFLGAHTVPGSHARRRGDYVDEVVGAQLDAVADIARFADVYVDRGAFTVDEARTILVAARARGLGLKVHAEQLSCTGAAAMAASLGATSADHLEHIDASGIEALAAAGTVAVLLPGAMTYLKDRPPPVAALREAGVRMAVATDFNPGSSPVRDLWATATLAAVSMGLTVTEALRGITVHAALALARTDLGHLGVGARADVLLVEPPPGEPVDPAVFVQYLGGHRPRCVLRGGRVR